MLGRVFDRFAGRKGQSTRAKAFVLSSAASCDRSVESISTNEIKYTSSERHSKRESDQRPCQPVSRVLLLAWMNTEPCSSSDTRCSELARGRSNRDDVKRRGSGCLDAASATIVANTARDCRCRPAPEPRLRASDRGPPPDRQLELVTVDDPSELPLAFTDSRRTAHPHE